MLQILLHPYIDSRRKWTYAPGMSAQEQGRLGKSSCDPFSLSWALPITLLLDSLLQPFLCTKPCLTLYSTVVLLYLQRQWLCFLKNVESFLQPTILRYCSSRKLDFTVCRISAQKSSTSSSALKYVGRRSIIHSTDSYLFLASSSYTYCHSML